MPGPVSRRSEASRVQPRPAPAAETAAASRPASSSARTASAPAAADGFRTASPAAAPAATAGDAARSLAQIRQSRRQKKAEKWENYDRQTVVRDGQVAHGASAGANLKEAGKNLVDMVDPTNHFRNSFKGSDPLGLSYALDVLLLPWKVMGEVADVVAGPFKIAKNLGDAAAHGVMAGVGKIFGRD